MARPDPERIRKWGHLAGIGPLLVASVLVGYFLGSWLDSRLGTSPVFLTLGVLVGAAAGFIELVRLLERLGAAERKRRRPGRRPEAPGGGGREERRGGEG